MSRPRRPDRRRPDALRAVAALFGFIVFPMLLVAVAVLVTLALLGSLVGA
jgi:hypothetical protein